MEIYTVMVCSRLEEDSNLGLLNTGSSRVWGFYSNQEDAIRAVKNNVTDIWEYSYGYAIIERMREGIPSDCLGRMFFKFDQESEKYYEIPEPECCRHICNFSMG